ncbi:hypothetical protein [Xylanimonas ulmi]|uniref:DUF4192 family protein n=1 Tax=Xylanimonas ulmi TaxID=228973 RepID=A0A4Q7M5A6_9MICO|nr:hypothetical protein [Xylanibacterium ulmi]RZS62213.1 hypothetical protein EV386_2534 [Xylanibacterium ulmi]
MPGSPIGEFLSSIPAQFGYVMNDRHVVAVGMARDGRTGPRIVAEWDQAVASDQDLAEHIAAHVARLAKASPEHKVFLLVGYGRDGAHRAALLRDALLATSALPDPLVAHVVDNTWRVQVRADAWTTPQDLPDVSAETVLAGLPSPVASRDELVARYQPSPTPAFGDIKERDRALFSASPPSFRAEVATATLDRLTRPALDDPNQMAVLAHLTISGPKAVRDAVMLAAAADAEHAAALVRVYRGAPETMRPALATAAGTALFLSGGGSVETEAILVHADRAGDNARLTALVAIAKRSGLNPHALRAELATQTKPALDEADLRWKATLSSSAFPKGGPTGAHPATERMREVPDRLWNPPCMER